jgi:hypothetical protein
MSNRHDFAGLIEAATPYAEEELRDRANSEKEKDAKRSRRRLRLVKDDGD